MSARFEIVRTDAGWHTRFQSSNGRTIWHTEVYKERKSALNAIAVTVAPFRGHWLDESGTAVMETGDSWTKTRRRAIEIRDVDERVQP